MRNSIQCNPHLTTGLEIDFRSQGWVKINKQTVV